MFTSSSTLEVESGVVLRVVVYDVESLKPIITQSTSLAFSEQLSAAAAAACDSVGAGVATWSAAGPMSSGVMMMPQRLPAAMHAFTHVNYPVVGVVLTSRTNG